MERSVSTGRRVWVSTAITISLLALLLTLAGIIGMWVAWAAAIDVATGILDGVSQLAEGGSEGVAQIDGGVAELRATVGTIETAADQITQEVADKGLVLTLLQPETEQELEATARSVGEGMDSIRSGIQAAIELIEAIGSLPFLNLPTPDLEPVQALQREVDGIREAVDQLEAELQAFREGVATEIAKLSAAASVVDRWLERTQQDLAGIDGELADLQERAKQLASRFRGWATVIAVLLSLILAWVSYALVALARGYRAELGV